jgi:pyruvate ferredoxin oxidoreductase beta subunit
MNTGIQRSSATPQGARTTTTPVGVRQPGKLQPRKDLTEIVAAHNVPYVAQASISHWGDLAKKLRKALSISGPTFLNVLTPCQPGWDYPSDQLVEVARLAVESRYWPLYEVDGGQHRLTFNPREPIPVRDWVGRQGRFKHLLTDQATLDGLQAWVDANWQRLAARAAAPSAPTRPA